MLKNPTSPFIDIFFEELSAFGTVGLSRGLTSQLTAAGRVVIMLSVLVGIIGPLTLALAHGKRKNKGTLSVSRGKNNGWLKEKMRKFAVIGLGKFGGTVAQNLLVSNVLDYLPISEKYSAAEIKSPKPFWNKKIGELKIREKYKVNILEIKKVSGEGQDKRIERINYLPYSEDIIEEGDIERLAQEE